MRNLVYNWIKGVIYLYNCWQKCESRSRILADIKGYGKKLNCRFKRGVNSVISLLYIFFY